MRLLRAYAASGRSTTRPKSAGGSDRMITRSHAVIDHARRDGIANFVSIVGGKLTTYRLMAEQTADVVAASSASTSRARPHRSRCPARVAAGATTGWATGSPRTRPTVAAMPALICECEFVTRPMLERFLAERWPCSLDDVRRGTRLGMGPCQGAFCTFRAAGIVADAVAGRTLRRGGRRGRRAAGAGPARAG